MLKKVVVAQFPDGLKLLFDVKQWIKIFRFNRWEA